MFRYKLKESYNVNRMFLGGFKVLKDKWTVPFAQKNEVLEKFIDILDVEVVDEHQKIDDNFKKSETVYLEPKIIKQEAQEKNSDKKINNDYNNKKNIVVDDLSNIKINKNHKNK